MSRQLIFALMILLAAAGLRLWQLADYPPGPHYDEAANVLITRSIAFGGARPFPIVNNYQGREVFFYYLTAPLFQFIYDGRFSLQLANAFMGLITIAATIALGREMFGGRQGVIIGLTAGALLALSFPQILLARQAFRAPTLPFLQVLALLCLWRGLNRGRVIWLILGGVFAGATLYTYMASRLFPGWLLLAGVFLIVIESGNRIRRLRQGALFFGVLAIVAAPMAIYALQNPDIFLGRLYEVTQAEQSITLAESITRHVKMFFINGEALLRYNLPGRPYFTWPEGILLLMGLIVCAWRILRPGRATERVGYVLALLSPLMIIPSVISVGGFPPNHMRSIGMVPLIFILIGVGVEGIIGILMNPTPLLPLPIAMGRGLRGGVFVASALLIASVLVGNVYFAWAGRADLYYDTDADLAAATDWIPAHTDADTLIYMAALDRDHPTVMIANLPNLTWLGTETLFLPPPGQTGLAIFPHSAPPPDDWAAWLEPFALADIPLAPDAQPAFAAYHLSADTPLPDLQTVPDSVENAALTLIGYRANPIFPNGSGEITLAWRVRQAPAPSDLTPVLEVYNQGDRLARAETPFRHTDDWRPGEVMLHRLKVRITAATPPGRYPIRLTWVAREMETYQPYVTASGQPAGLWATVGEIEVLKPLSFPDPEDLDIANRADIDATPGVKLLGWSSLPETRRPGESIDLSLYWQATEDNPADMERGVWLLRDGFEIPLTDESFRYPPSQWSEGEIVREASRWSLDRDLENGDYTLALRIGEARVELGTLTVAGIPRIFEAPPGITQTDIALGDALGLYGYDFEREESGFRLLLVWDVRQPVVTDYSVFVHVLDDAGNIVAQRDVMPMDNTYPTSLWVAGEYISDEHAFRDLPPGDYHVRVGLYDQATSTRLKRTSGEDFVDVGSISVP